MKYLIKSCLYRLRPYPSTIVLLTVLPDLLIWLPASNIYPVSSIYSNHLYIGLAMASLKGHGIAAKIKSIAIPKNNNVRLCFAAGVGAFFTETRPT